MTVANLNKLFKQLFTFKGFLFAFIVIYLLPKNIFSLPGLGLDDSWRLSLNMALGEDLLWGKDIIFTFGPLGYLATGHAFNASKLSIILFYLFISINGIYFIYYLFKKLSAKKDLVFIVTIFFFLGFFLFNMDTITLYFYFIFHVFHYLKYNNRLSLVIVSICALLAFYIKVNTGIVLNVLFVLFVFYNYLFGVKAYLNNTLYFVIHLLILWVISQVLNVDLVPYILNSFSIIDSYNDAMVIVPSISSVFGAMLILFIIFLSLISYLKMVLKDFYEMFLFSNIFLLVFITFKQSFVRADGHTFLFFSCITFIIILAYLFSNIGKIKNSLYYCIIVIPIVSLSFLDVGPGIAHQMKMGYNLFTSHNHKERNMSENRGKRKLPPRVIREIGNSSVDVLGYETSFVFYNNLKYLPRPIFQSYTAYNAQLIDINCNKYNSEHAPDYVLYHFGSIDDRHQFWDEPKIYLSLFKNYDIFDTIPATDDFPHQLILFKKNKVKKTITEHVLRDSVLQFDSEFFIPKSKNILYLEIDFEYTIAGKIKRILFQPSLIKMNLFYEDHTSTYCHMLLPVMKSGVPINKKVVNDSDAYTFFNSKGSENLNASSFVLKGNEGWFENSFRVKIIEYTID